MTALIKYEAACLALAECKAVDEVKAWADKAAAMQAYGRMAKDKTLEVDAAEIRIRAERRLGELIAAQKAGPGLAKGVRMAGGGESPVVVRDDRRETPTLAEAGISKDLSSRAQKLAAVPEDEFEAELAAKRERDREEGARVSARLEAAGEQAMKGNKVKREPEPEPKRQLVEAGEVQLLRDQIDELTANLREATEDNESMARVFEADDKVKAAMAEAKRYRELNRILEERIAGLMNEKNAAIRAAKSWQRKAEAAERAAA
jgi:hypothetical protein